MSFSQASAQLRLIGKIEGQVLPEIDVTANAHDRFDAAILRDNDCDRVLTTMAKLKG